MKLFSAQYVFTGTGPPLKRAIISTEDDGTIVRVEDTGGKLSEQHSVSFYNGIILPGFVNSHCHLELSFLRNEIDEKTGLGRFLMTVNSIRNKEKYDIPRSIINADKEMQKEGIVLCGDICNTSATFSLKRESIIKYISLLEIFGIDESKANKRLEEVTSLASEAEANGLTWAIVPHAFYSMSVRLLDLVSSATSSNKIHSIHFLESEDEISFLKNHTGPLMDSYKRFLSPLSNLETVKDHISAVLNKFHRSGNLILVHNTYIEREHIELLRERKNLYYCLCPNSNIYIENSIAPAGLLYALGCETIIGTDSLSSNHSLSIIEEIKTIQNHYPEIPLEVLIRWATLNGARALGEESWAGSIEPGKKPGLLLIKNADLANMRLLPDSSVQRLI